MARNLDQMQVNKRLVIPIAYLIQYMTFTLDAKRSLSLRDVRSILKSGGDDNDMMMIMINFFKFWLTFKHCSFINFFILLIKANYLEYKLL